MSFYSAPSGAQQYGDSLLANLTEDQVKEHILGKDRRFLLGQHVDILGFVRSAVTNLASTIGNVITGILSGDKTIFEGLDFAETLSEAFQPFIDEVKRLEQEQADVVAQSQITSESISKAHDDLQALNEKIQNLTLDGILTEDDRNRLLAEVADTATSKIDQIQNELLADLDARVRETRSFIVLNNLAGAAKYETERQWLRWKDLTEKFMLLQTQINEKIRYLFEANDQTKTLIAYWNTRRNNVYISYGQEIRIEAFHDRKGLKFSATGSKKTYKLMVQARTSEGNVDIAVFQKRGNVFSGSGSTTNYNSSLHSKVIMPYNDWLSRIGASGSSVGSLENIVTFTDSEAIMIAGGFTHQYEDVIFTYFPEYQPELLGHKGEIVENIKKGLGTVSLTSN